MNGNMRRDEILRMLRQVEKPLTGAELAKRLGVSRQVIVQDMALLRARTDVEILSTHYGYAIYTPKDLCRRVFKVRHSSDRTEEELQQIVDLGGYVEDVFVSHKVYGVIRGMLQVGSRQDIRDFMERLKNSSSAPLMQITDDFHYHTVTAGSVQRLDQIEEKLRELGFLAPLLEYEPVEFRRE